MTESADRDPERLGVVQCEVGEDFDGEGSRRRFGRRVPDDDGQEILLHRMLCELEVRS